MKVDSGEIHPFRYKRTRPFSRQVVRLAEQHRANYHGVALFDAIVAVVIENYKRALSAVPFAERPVNSMPTVQSEGSTAVQFARFAASGRNTFVLTPTLVEMLQRTDMAGVRLSDLILPFNSFYLGFAGAYDGALPGPPNQIDGAYVERVSGDHLTIFLTSRRLDAPADTSAGWPSNRDRYFAVHLVDQGGDTSLLDAFTTAVTKELQSDPAYEALREVIDDPSLDLPLGMEARLNPEPASQEIHALFASGVPSAAAAVALIGNALCYLSASPEVSTPDLPADAPLVQARAAMTGTGTIQQRARAELLEQGISVIHWLGPNQAARSPSKSTRGESGVKTAAHWRRGHWRRQAHGLGGLERRLIWIAPMIVGVGAPVGRDRVYQVDEPRD